MSEPSPPAATDTPAAAPGLAPSSVALLYAACAALWILLSDKLLELWLSDAGHLALAGAIKGWLFVAVTAVLLYTLLRRRPAGAAAPGLPPRTLRRGLVLAAAVTAVLTLAAIAYSVERNKRIDLVRLQAVADLKVQLLEDWLHERSTDARLLRTGSDAAALYRRWQDQGDAGARSALLERLTEQTPMTPFSGVSLWHESGQRLWRSGGTAGGPTPAVLAELRRLAQQREVRRLGPYLDADGLPHTDFVAPLPAPAGQPAALLVFHLEGARYLPETLHRWPVPSRTGEVVLVRRVGDEMEYMTPLRRAPDAALRLRRPMSDTRLLPVQLMTARDPQAAVLDGVNFSGDAAFGRGRPVPGTDWFLLARMDDAELHATALQEGLWIVLAGALGLFVAAAGLYLERQRRELAQAARVQHAQRQRLQAAALLQAVVDSSVDAIFAKDTEGRYLLWNRAAAAVVGKPADAVVGKDDHAVFPPAEAEMLRTIDREALAAPGPVTREETVTTPTGVRTFLATKGPLRDADGRTLGTFGISRDVTDARRADQALRRAHRALLTRQECGQALMRASDEAGLLREVCDILVQTGGYRMTWVGYAEADDPRHVRPMAQAGFDDRYLDTVRITWADEPAGRGPTGTAIREQRPVVARHILTDPQFGPWRDAALARGYASSIAVPLLPQPGECIGALMLYADAPDAFDDEELRLVTELGNDLAYGIRALRDRAARLDSERLLREQKEQLSESQRIAHVGTWVLDWRTQVLRWSHETFRLYGMVPADDPPPLAAVMAAIHADDRAPLLAWLRAIGASSHGDQEFECRAQPRGGEPRVLNLRCTVERDTAGRPLRLVGTVQDVTAARAAEAERLAQEARYRALFASNPHPMWVYDRETLRFLEVNDATVTKYGYTREQFLAMSIADLRPPEELPRLHAFLAARRGDFSEASVWRHRLHDGRLVDVEVSSHALDFDGRAAVVVLAHDVTEQLRAEASLTLQARRATALLELPDLAEDMDETSFMQRAQELAEDLTGSRISFIHFVHPDGETIELVTWSRRTLEVFCTAGHERHHPISQAGAWADALRLREPVVINDYRAYPHKRGLPEGHAEIDRMVAAPVIEGGRVVMLAGVGGKAADYGATDVETVQLIANDTWRLVQRRRSDLALQASEANFRALTEQVPAIIYRASLEAMGTTTYVSPAVQSLGWTPQEWVDDPGLWAGNLHAEDRDRVLAQLRAAQDACDSFDLQYRLRDRSGRWCHFHDKAAVVRDAAGKPQYLQGLMVDVTAQMQTEASLRQLSQAVEQSPNSIVVTNLKAEIEYVNQAFLDITGYRRDEVIGRNPRILHGDDVGPGSYAPMWDALTAGQPWKGEFSNKRKDGRPLIEFGHVAPLRQPDGRITHYVAVKEDITERKRIASELDRHRHHLEELVQERTAELAEARQRAEAASLAKSAFLANMSHEIRTPMNAIVGLSYLLQHEPLLPRQADRLAQINTSAQHLLSIITGILDLSKIEAGKLVLEETDFHIGAVLDHVQSLLAERALGKGLALHVDAGDVPPWLHGDLVRLRQALLNFADNAVKFTERGEIRLRARLLDSGPAGLMVRFEVQDTGIGIDPEVLPRLFEAFEQADTSTTRRYGGTGLGLAVAKRLAQLMGGTAGVDSQPGVGSTFWLTARLGPGRSRTPAAALPPVHDAQAELLRRCRGARVLLVEDDAINREVALELLAAAGLSVSTAVDGREALQRLGDDRFDLVLMDLQMPGMDGYQATRLLRALPDAAQLPVVAMSANAFEEVRQACLAAGMNDFVPKPVEPGLLYTTLLRWLPQVADAAAPAAARPAAAAAALTPAPRLAALARALAAIDGLAIDACLSALHGDLTLYTALLQQLARSHGNDAGAIAGHLAAGRFDEAQQLAHRLKGAAGALGAKPLQEAAAALDASLRRHDPPAQQQPLCLTLAEASGRLFQAIARLPAEPGGDAPPAPDAARTRALLLQLEPLLAADDTAAGELFDHHRELLRATLGAVAARLGWQMERYDYPAALQTVRQALAEASAA